MLSESFLIIVSLGTYTKAFCPQPPRKTCPTTGAQQYFTGDKQKWENLSLLLSFQCILFHLKKMASS